MSRPKGNGMCPVCKIKPHSAGHGYCRDCRHAPLDAESQARHDSTEYDSERLVVEITEAPAAG